MENESSISRWNIKYRALNVKYFSTSISTHCTRCARKLAREEINGETRAQVIDLSRLFSKTMKKICPRDFSQSVFLNIQYLP